MSERKVKIRKKCERAEQHPLYVAFTQQIGAALVVARQIDADKTRFQTPPFVERFLNEFERKTV